MKTKLVTKNFIKYLVPTKVYIENIGTCVQILLIDLCSPVIMLRDHDVIRIY